MPQCQPGSAAAIAAGPVLRDLAGPGGNLNLNRGYPMITQAGVTVNVTVAEPESDRRDFKFKLPAAAAINERSPPDSDSGRVRQSMSELKLEQLELGLNWKRFGLGVDRDSPGRFTVTVNGMIEEPASR